MTQKNTNRKVDGPSIKPEDAHTLLVTALHAGIEPNTSSKPAVSMGDAATASLPVYPTDTLIGGNG